MSTLFHDAWLESLIWNDKFQKEINKIRGEVSAIEKKHDCETAVINNKIKKIENRINEIHSDKCNVQTNFEKKFKEMIKSEIQNNVENKLKELNFNNINSQFANQIVVR